ncbi:MAG: hypothetical protein R3C29_17090 [Dehalococcoidia bacterium]
MSWFKKLFGRDSGPAQPPEAMRGASPSPMDALQTDEERARIREQMEKELEDQAEARGKS